MMPYPLTLQSILRPAATFWRDRETVSREGPGRILRYTYADLVVRSARLAAALRELGVRSGDRVGTLAGNRHRHLEAYFAVPCMGAVLHTINFRLFTDQLAHVVNHARDRVLLVDPDLLPVVEAMRDRLATVRHVVALGHEEIGDALAYERLLPQAPPWEGWPALDEWSAAATCHTSATTGNPKGAVYSHRAIFLHTMTSGLADVLGLTERDVVLPVVPMFHVNHRHVLRRQAGPRRAAAGPAYAAAVAPGRARDADRGRAHGVAGLRAAAGCVRCAP